MFDQEIIRVNVSFRASVDVFVNKVNPESNIKLFSPLQSNV
jgi:hypothetical protein